LVSFQLFTSKKTGQKKYVTVVIDNEKVELLGMFLPFASSATLGKKVLQKPRVHASASEGSRLTCNISY
jgi:hypothetical protein